MSTTDDIRAALKAGPLKPSAIADQLGITDQAERTRLYAAVRQMHVNERGIEQLDDGTVSLVPGWKPSRGAGAAEAAEALIKPSRTSSRKAKPGKARKAAKPKASRKPAGRRNAAPSAVPAPAPRASADADHLASSVSIPRGSVRSLLAFIMQSTRPLDAQTRSAVAEAVECAA